MTPLHEWAAHWQVSPAALEDLRGRMGVVDTPQHATAGKADESEAAVQVKVRLAASRYGMRLWRNNVGAVHDNEAGVHLRYGLANDSPQVNAVCKSGDLIGIRPRIIQPEDVGQRIGQFVSLECKRRTWRWAGTEREIAQQNWALLVNSLGGEARFISDEREL